MKKARITAVATLVVAAMTCAPLWAAHLTIISRQQARTGPETDTTRVTAALVDPSSSIASVSAHRLRTLEAPGAPDCTYTGVGVNIEFQIDPDLGEEIGDPVVVKYYWTANAMATTSGSEFGAQASVGAGDPTHGCSPLGIGYPDAIQIVRNPLGSATVEFSYPPRKLTAPPTATPLHDAGHGIFAAAIGDTITSGFGAIAGVEWTGVAAGSAEAGSDVSLRVELTAPGAVPTLSWVGLGALAALLAAAAAFALKR